MSDVHDAEVHDVQTELKAYKAEILPVNKARLALERDLYFMGTTQRGYEVEFDVKYEEGCSPTETFLLSVAGCLSIDVVHILRKMRCEISRYILQAKGSPPKRSIGPSPFQRTSTALSIIPFVKTSR
jgi:hypothetical protein